MNARKRETPRDRDSETETQTENDRDTETQTQRHRQKENDRDTKRGERHRETERGTRVRGLGAYHSQCLESSLIDRRVWCGTEELFGRSVVRTGLRGKERTDSYETSLHTPTDHIGEKNVSSVLIPSLSISLSVRHRDVEGKRSLSSIPSNS